MVTIALLTVLAGLAVADEWNIGPCSFDVADPCKDDDIVFYLYSKEDPHDYEILTLSNSEPSRVKFDPSLPTKVIIHGYVGSVEFNSTSELRAAYLSLGGVNVLAADWHRYAAAPCYPVAVLNTRHTGRCAGRFLAALRSRFPNMAALHVVGHSLGAHIAAFASNELLSLTGRRVDRITGLDPALPFFATLKSSWKLDADDAPFVDAIHTNAGVFGKIEPAGDVDFYVNGGSSQPACGESRTEDGRRRKLLALDYLIRIIDPPLCSHLMSAVYFAESVSSKVGFWGTPCPSYWYYLRGYCSEEATEGQERVLMGEYSSTRATGIFLVRTRDSAPFALG